MEYMRIYIFTVFLTVYGAKLPNRSLPEDCGIAKAVSKKSTRIVKGEAAALGQFPWMARLGMLKNATTRDISFYCGGSLVSRLYVISAAHCEEDMNIVRLGENNVRTNVDCDEVQCAPPHQDILIKNRYFEDICRVTLTNDLQVIELEKPAVFNDFVQSVCLPNRPLSYQDLMDKPLIISGWGRIHEVIGIRAEHLMYITASLFEREKCNKLFKTELLDSQLCIGNEEGKDSCEGDSGGPVIHTMYENGTGRAYLVGLVSYGLRFCGHGPAVYTDISSFLDSIFEKVIEN